MKKELVLEGLSCAMCADKIEKNIKEIDGVASASMNFATKTLMFEAERDDDIEAIIQRASAIIKTLEPHVTVTEKILSRPVKKVLLLVGLGCADCAARIEKEIRSLPGVKSAVVDFAAKKLIIEADSKKELDIIAEKASKIAMRIESGIKVTEDAHDEDDKLESTRLVRLGIGAALFLLAVFAKFSFGIELAIFLLSYIMVGGDVVYKAVRNIAKGHIFDENFLMTIATLGAFAIKEFPEGVAVMLFYQIGELFQDIAVNRSRRSIASLMNIRPDYASLKEGDDIRQVSPEDVSLGDIIVVRPGEKVPLDGLVLEGVSMLDTSALTGESAPREVEAGSVVLSGSINKNGLLLIRVTKTFGESTVSRILDLVQNASARKAVTENFITKFARYYTPIVVFLAVALAFIPPLIIPNEPFSEWINRALVFMVVSCPCALVISIPLGFFGGIGGASKNGILVKGSNYLEALNNVDTMVFDKTGTLTKGIFKVSEIKTAGAIDKTELLELAAYAESYSSHPIAVSIIKAYGGQINSGEITDYDELSGFGIKAVIKGRNVLIGNSRLLKKENIDVPEEQAAGTAVYIAIDGEYAGSIVISDELKEDSKKTIQDLKKAGIKKIVMLTGDSRHIAELTGRELELDEVYSELLPDQKVEKLEMLDKGKTTGGKLVFVGDGINDAPVLARADVGVAMGGVGSDAAIEAADVVLMTDEPSKLVLAIKIAKRTRNIVWQNIIFAISVKVIVLILGAGGIATMWEAVFADVGVALLAILNSMRVMKVNFRRLP